MTLADGNPTVTLEGTVYNLARRIADVAARQLQDSAPADLAALIDAQADDDER